MKEGWTYKKLGEVCLKITDGSHNPPHGVEKSCNYMLSSQNVQNGYLDMSSVRYLSDENFRIENKRTQAKKGDVLLTIVGTIGRTCVLDGTEGNITFQRSVAILKPSEEINSYFLMYFLLSQNSNLNSTAQGAAQKGIYLKQLGNIELHYPSLSEQQSIVDYLDSAFAKIDAMNANAEKALGEAKALFQATLKEMLEPKEGWAENRMDKVCSIARGGSPRPIKDFITNDPDGLNWIKIGDTDMGGKYIYRTKEKIKPEGLKKSRWVEVDDFLLSNSMSFGRPYILKTNGCIHDGWLVLRDYQQYLNIDFFYYVLSSDNVQRQFRTKAQGSTVSNLNTDRVASVTISVPPLNEQQSIVATLDSLKSKVDRLQENFDKICQECDALKQAILRQVFE